MRRAAILGCFLGLAACSDTPTDPVLADVDPRFAAQGSGAYVVSETWNYAWTCTYQTSRFYCDTARGHLEAVITPGGNINTTYNEPYLAWEAGTRFQNLDGTFWWRVTSGEETGSTHSWHHNANQVTNTEHWSYKRTWTVTEPDHTEECYATYDYRVVNDKVVRTVNEYQCI